MSERKLMLLNLISRAPLLSYKLYHPEIATTDLLAIGASLGSKEVNFCAGL